MSWILHIHVTREGRSRNRFPEFRVLETFFFISHNMDVIGKKHHQRKHFHARKSRDSGEFVNISPAIVNTLECFEFLVVWKFLSRNSIRNFHTRESKIISPIELHEIFATIENRYKIYKLKNTDSFPRCMQTYDKLDNTRL